MYTINYMTICYILDLSGYRPESRNIRLTTDCVGMSRAPLSEQGMSKAGR